MAAYEFFATTTTNLFIEHIKTKAEAYGWIIDFFGLYAGNNRLHLHNSHGAHFDIWYGSTVANIVGCTGYDSGATSLLQPNVSAVQYIASTWDHFIVIGKQSITVKISSSAGAYRVQQYGSISKKVGAREGGIFISNSTYQSSTTTYSCPLWGGYNFSLAAVAKINGQIYINGGWSSNGDVYGGSWPGGTIRPVCSPSLYGKMPFVYSGGILPVTALLMQANPSSPTLFCVITPEGPASAMRRRTTTAPRRKRKRRPLRM